MIETPAAIGRYEVLGILGKGAMGVVYKAVDPVIDRVVAIKTIRLSLSEEELAFYEARFAQEIKTVGKLNHPNIVTIFDVGRTSDFAYMAMEFIEGPELKQLVAPGKPLHTSTSVAIVAQVAEGLAFAHARGIVHRDVKPSNIMIALDDDHLVAKVTDFGIARAPTSAVKTMTGMILGSPRYMSPEHVIGKSLDARSDVFSLGVVLYEMLAGAAPFDADSVSSIMYHTVHTPEEPLAQRNAAIPAPLATVVARAMAKAPEQRFATMKELARALREVARELPAPLASLELSAALPAPAAGAPPDPASAGSAGTAPGHMLALEFDSTAATMRLAEMTAPSLDVTRILPPAPPPPEVTPPAVAATEAVAAKAPPEPLPPPVAPLPFPWAPAALLGTLGVLALGLGIALVL